MGKSKGQNLDPYYYGKWQVTVPCSCGTSQYETEKIYWTEVPMMQHSTKVAYNVGRVALGLLTLGISEAAAGKLQDITHEAVEVHYRCKSCSGVFKFTYQILNESSGKLEDHGYYVKEYGVVAQSSSKRSYAFVMKQFEKMWEDYHPLYNNCKDWSRDFYIKIS